MTVVLGEYFQRGGMCVIDLSSVSAQICSVFIPNSVRDSIPPDHSRLIAQNVHQLKRRIVEQLTTDAIKRNPTFLNRRDEFYYATCVATVLWTAIRRHALMADGLLH